MTAVEIVNACVLQATGCRVFLSTQREFDKFSRLLREYGIVGTEDDVAFLDELWEKQKAGAAAFGRAGVPDSTSDPSTVEQEEADADRERRPLLTAEQLIAEWTKREMTEEVDTAFRAQMEDLNERVKDMDKLWKDLPDISEADARTAKPIFTKIHESAQELMRMLHEASMASITSAMLQTRVHRLEDAPLPVDPVKWQRDHTVVVEQAFSGKRARMLTWKWAEEFTGRHGDDDDDVWENQSRGERVRKWRREQRRTRSQREDCVNTDIGDHAIMGAPAICEQCWMPTTAFCYGTGKDKYGQGVVIQAIGSTPSTSPERVEHLWAHYHAYRELLCSDRFIQPVGVQREPVDHVAGLTGAVKGAARTSSAGARSGAGSGAEPGAKGSRAATAQAAYASSANSVFASPRGEKLVTTFMYRQENGQSLVDLLARDHETALRLCDCHEFCQNLLGSVLSGLFAIHQQSTRIVTRVPTSKNVLIGVQGTAVRLMNIAWGNQLEEDHPDYERLLGERETVLLRAFGCIVGAATAADLCELTYKPICGDYVARAAEEEGEEVEAEVAEAMAAATAEYQGKSLIPDGLSEDVHSAAQVSARNVVFSSFDRCRGPWERPCIAVEANNHMFSNRVPVPERPVLLMKRVFVRYGRPFELRIPAAWIEALDAASPLAEKEDPRDVVPSQSSALPVWSSASPSSSSSAASPPLPTSSSSSSSCSSFLCTESSATSACSSATEGDHTPLRLEQPDYRAYVAHLVPGYAVLRSRQDGDEDGSSASASASASEDELLRVLQELSSAAAPYPSEGGHYSTPTGTLTDDGSLSIPIVPVAVGSGVVTMRITRTHDATALAELRRQAVRHHRLRTRRNAESEDASAADADADNDAATETDAETHGNVTAGVDMGADAGAPLGEPPAIEICVEVVILPAPCHAFLPQLAQELASRPEAYHLDDLYHARWFGSEHATGEGGSGGGAEETKSSSSSSSSASSSSASATDLHHDHELIIAQEYEFILHAGRPELDASPEREPPSNTADWLAAAHDDALADGTGGTFDDLPADGYGEDVEAALAELEVLERKHQTNKARRTRADRDGAEEAVWDRSQSAHGAPSDDSEEFGEYNASKPHLLQVRVPTVQKF